MTTFTGRAHELGQLETLLGRARAGRPAVVVIEGPAGIGKSALLNHFLGTLEPSVRILRSAAVEASRPLAVWAQLIADEQAHDVPDPGLRLLALLREPRPVVLAVDDVQWMDRASADALAFALRRLRTEKALVILLCQDIDAAGSPRELTSARAALRLPLAGLDAGQLLRAFPGKLTCQTAERVREHTEGNPRHVREVLRQATPAELGDPYAPLPVPRAHALLARKRLADCGTEAAALTAAAAVLSSVRPAGPLPVVAEPADAADPLLVVAELADVADPLPAADEAVRAGLLRARQTGSGLLIGFTHPMLGHAVLATLGMAERIRLHARAAGLHQDETVRLEHRLRALTGSDPVLMAEVVTAGRRLAGEGSWARAAALLRAAAGMGAGTSAEVAEALVMDGRLAQARELAARLPPAERPFADGMISYASGRTGAAVRLLREAQDRCRSPRLRARIDEHLAIGHRLDPAGYLRLMRHGDSPPARLLHASLQAEAAYLDGHWDAAHVAVPADVGASTWTAGYAHAVASLVPAARGDWQEAAGHVRAAHGTPDGAVAAAFLAAARNRPEEVIAALAHQPEAGLNAVHWPDLLAEALLAVGSPERAQAVHQTHGTGPRVLAMLLALQDDDLGRQAFEQALLEDSTARSRRPFEHARTLLAYGATLRRTGRRSAAAAHLTAALHVFRDLRARPHEKRCAGELAACGVRRVRTAEGLTPQQDAVAQLVATGLTNAQIARELALSVKTVEYHVGQAYRRLGVGSRVALANKLTDRQTPYAVA